MRVFISQPMSGFSDKEITEARDRAVAKLQRKYPDAVIITSQFQFIDLEDSEYPVCKDLLYLAGALKLMATCDTILMVDGWDKARGCLIEYEAAKKYNHHTILYESQFD